MCERAFVVSGRLRWGDAVASSFPPVTSTSKVAVAEIVEGRTIKRTPDRVGTADATGNWNLTWNLLKVNGGHG
jgi:hypothetical protein